MKYPITRLRRLRIPLLRDMIRETRVSLENLVLPLFVAEGKGVCTPISSLPGHFRYSPDRVGEAVEEALEMGIFAFLLFGIPGEKRKEVRAEREGPVQKALLKMRRNFPQAFFISDICLCSVTEDGSCEITELGNDGTLPILAEMAISHVQAGADMVAPSDMMDGRVGVIRTALDKAGYLHTPILSYAVKYASAFYAPFRIAADSAPKEGDRRGYQMDPANSREAMREVALDLEEGADIVMVKPALPCLDIIYQIKERFQVPVAAYHVSGTYAMVKAAASKGLISEEAVFYEMLLSIKRAGADIIITYAATDIARMLRR